MTRTGLTTDGSEFLLPDGTPYSGPYHIHSTSGPMVGATHTQAPHQSLTAANETVQQRVSAVMNELVGQEAERSKRTRISARNTAPRPRTTPRTTQRRNRTTTRRSGSGGY